MELKRRFDWRKVAYILYMVIFAIYIIVGLQPVEAKNYEISAELFIPSIRLDAEVTTLHLSDTGLETPDTIVGSYTRARGRILLIGHASTVFRDLDKVMVGDKITYDETDYRVTGVETLTKEAVNMNKLLRAEERETIVLMTCAGTDLGDGDATHRLIITAAVDEAE